MQSANTIYDELVALDPSLAQHKQEIMKAIQALLAEKPDTKFDQAFARELKKSLLLESTADTPKASLFGRMQQHFQNQVRMYA